MCPAAASDVTISQTGEGAKMGYPTESFSGVRGDFSERLESLPSRSERL